MNSLSAFLSILFEARKQAHIYHLQVKGLGSYAAHKALNEFYDGLLDLIDGLAESAQGKYGIITGYTNAFEVKDLNTIQDALLFIQELAILVETERATIPQDSFIQNQVDELVALLYSTVYKLQNLQ
jgi:DNA-binding ferritin-like protein